MRYESLALLFGHSTLTSPELIRQLQKTIQAIAQIQRLIEPLNTDNDFEQTLDMLRECEASCLFDLGKHQALISEPANGAGQQTNIVKYLTGQITKYKSDRRNERLYSILRKNLNIIEKATGSPQFRGLSEELEAAFHAPVPDVMPADHEAAEPMMNYDDLIALAQQAQIPYESFLKVKKAATLQLPQLIAGSGDDGELRKLNDLIQLIIANKSRYPHWDWSVHTKLVDAYVNFRAGMLNPEIYSVQQQDYARQAFLKTIQHSLKF